MTRYRYQAGKISNEKIGKPSKNRKKSRKPRNDRPAACFKISYRGSYQSSRKESENIKHTNRSLRRCQHHEVFLLPREPPLRPSLALFLSAQLPFQLLLLLCLLPLLSIPLPLLSLLPNLQRSE